MTAPAPTVCRTCRGDGYVGTVTRSWCPGCKCVQCGAETDTPPECRDCGIEEDARAVRRADI